VTLQDRRAEGAVVLGASDERRRVSSSSTHNAVYLPPGQVHVSAEPIMITTILGSCVAVCLLDRRRSWGGVNHFLLPRGASQAPSPRFGDRAMPELLDAVLGLGSRRGDLEAKVFGGARILPARSGGRDLGQENVEAALAFLEGEGIPVVARHTGGRCGRKVIFDTSDGVVWLKTF
jgi:chemotaxis protein CheD